MTELTQVALLDEPKENFRIHIPHVILLLALFISLRLLFLLSFPIFNDEAIYIQYSQMIHSNWDKFKFISVNNIFGDWKPPLIYWICSLFIDLFGNPVLAARLVAVAVSLTGLLSVYFFAGHYFENRRIALWAGLFWTLNPMVLFYDREFVAETFVYSFTTATFLFAYLTISKNRWYVLPAIIFGALTLLTKQTGQLFMLGLVFLAILQVKIRPLHRLRSRFDINYMNLLFILLTIALPYLIYRIVIPSTYFRDYHKYATIYTFTINDIAQFPIAAWLNNFTRIFNLFTHYYSLLSLVLVLVFVYMCIVVRNKRDLLLLAWYVITSCVILFAFKYFNEYIYNTAVIALLTLMMGSSVNYLEKAGKNLSGPILRYTVQYGAPCLLIVIWVYSFSYYYISPRDYIKKFGSPWMQENYYLGWPSGFGIDDVVTLLKKHQHKYVLLDPQWGNPGTGVMVFSKSLPSLKFMWMSEPLIKSLNSAPPNTVIAVFKYRPDRPGFRVDHEVLAQKICENKTVFQWEENQLPLVVCQN